MLANRTPTQQPLSAMENIEEGELEEEEPSFLLGPPAGDHRGGTGMVPHPVFLQRFRPPRLQEAEYLHLESVK